MTSRRSVPAAAVDDFAIGHALSAVARRRWSNEEGGPPHLSDAARALLESGEVPRVARFFDPVDR